MVSYSLFIYLLSSGKGENFTAYLQHQGIPGATLFRARERGPLQQSLLSSRSYKDLIFVIAGCKEGKRWAKLVEDTAIEMSYEKPSLFSLPLESFISKRQGPINEHEEDEMDKYAMIAIVEANHAHFVVDAIESITPFEGTLLKGEGTGHQAMLMPLSAEVGKDVVLAFVDKELYQEVEAKIEESLRLKEEGKGILMSLLAKEIY